MSHQSNHASIQAVTRIILAVLAFLLNAIPAHACPDLKLDHIAVLVADTHRTVSSLRASLGGQPYGELITMSDRDFGKLRLSYLDLGGFWLELVEPVGLGPLAKQIGAVGSGGLIELNFETPDLTACSERLARRGVALHDVSGVPFESGVPGHVLEPYGLRFAYIDQRITNGLSIELYQRGPFETDFLLWRDRLKKLAATRSGVRFGTINLLVRDLGKTVSVFEKLGFTPMLRNDCGDAGDPKRPCKVAIVSVGNVSIRLKQPDADSSESATQHRAGQDVIESLTVIANQRRFKQLKAEFGASTRGDPRSAYYRMSKAASAGINILVEPAEGKLPGGP